jgi:hypothetical protein
MTTTNGPVTWRAVGELTERVARLEEWRTAAVAGRAARGNRTWVIVMAVITGVVAPLILTSVLTWLHLRST